MRRWNRRLLARERFGGSNWSGTPRPHRLTGHGCKPFGSCGTGVRWGGLRAGALDGDRINRCLGDDRHIRRDFHVWAVRKRSGGKVRTRGRTQASSFDGAERCRLGSSSTRIDRASLSATRFGAVQINRAQIGATQISARQISRAGVSGTACLCVSVGQHHRIPRRTRFASCSTASRRSLGSAVLDRSPERPASRGRIFCDCIAPDRGIGDETVQTRLCRINNGLALAVDGRNRRRRILVNDPIDDGPTSVGRSARTRLAESTWGRGHDRDFVCRGVIGGVVFRFAEIRKSRRQVCSRRRFNARVRGVRSRRSRRWCVSPGFPSDRSCGRRPCDGPHARSGRRGGIGR